MNKKFANTVARAVSALAAVSLISVSAQAAYTQTGDYTVRLYGKVLQAAQDNTINVQMFMPDKDLDDLYAASKADYTSIVAYQNEVECGENGDYAIDIDLEGISGLYNTYLYFDSKVVCEPVVYSNPDLNVIALGELNAAAALEDEDAALAAVKTVISEKQFDLGFYLPVYDMVDKDKVAKFIYNQVKKQSLDVNDRDGAKVVFCKAVVSQALLEKKLSDLFVYADELALDESRIADFYDAEFVTDVLKSTVTKNMHSKNCVDVSGFDKALEEAFVLGVVEKPNGYKNIGPVVNKFASDIGITSVSDDICNSLAGKKFSSYAGLKTAITSPGGNQGGGGSGGGGGGAGGGGGVTKPNVPTVSIADGTSVEDAKEISGEDLFKDLSGVKWAADAINALAKDGIVNGKGNGSFCPDDNVTREEFVKMIVNALEISGGDRKMEDFSDVKKDGWYYSFVEKAYSAGIINGYDDESFGVGDFITRQDMAKIAYGAALSAGKNGLTAASGFTFADDALISDYAKASVYALYGAKIINGMTENEFAAQGLATRAQAAKIIHLLRSL